MSWGKGVTYALRGLEGKGLAFPGPKGKDQDPVTPPSFGACDKPPCDPPPPSWPPPTSG